MSRIITFVFAAALATVVVLVLTLSNLFPLERTQIFFLTTVPKSSIEIEIQPFSLNDESVREFKENFVKEYIKIRNEVIPNITLMRSKWQSGAGGNSVYALSSLDVFSAFTETAMFNVIMNEIKDSEFRCSVEFTRPMEPYAFISESNMSTYKVHFKYFCADSTGQTPAKDYTILISVAPLATIKWSDRLENPLGLVITEYRVLSPEGTDPLDL